MINRIVLSLLLIAHFFIASSYCINSAEPANSDTKWGLHFQNSEDFYQTHYELRRRALKVAKDSITARVDFQQFLIFLHNSPVYFGSYQKSFVFNAEPFLSVLNSNPSSPSIAFEILDLTSSTIDQDLHELVELWDISFDILKDNNTLEERQRWLNYIKEHWLNNRVSIVGRDATGRIITVALLTQKKMHLSFSDGTQHYCDSVWQINNVGVHIDFIGTHVGRDLFQYIENLNIEYGLLEVLHDNVAGVKLYQQAGFVIIGSHVREGKHFLTMTRNYVCKDKVFTFRFVPIRAPISEDEKS